MESKNRWKCNCWSSNSYQLQDSQVLSGAVRPSPPASSRELEDNNPAAATEAAAGQVGLFGEAWPFPKKQLIWSQRTQLFAERLQTPNLGAYYF